MGCNWFKLLPWSLPMLLSGALLLSVCGGSARAHSDVVVSPNGLLELSYTIEGLDLVGPLDETTFYPRGSGSSWTERGRESHALQRTFSSQSIPHGGRVSVRGTALMHGGTEGYLSVTISSFYDGDELVQLTLLPDQPVDYEASLDLSVVDGQAGVTVRVEASRTEELGAEDGSSLRRYDLESISLRAQVELQPVAEPLEEDSVPPESVPAAPTAPEEGEGPLITADFSLLAGLAALPLPDNLAQLAAGVILPGLLTLILGALGGQSSPISPPQDSESELDRFRRQYEAWKRTAHPGDANYEQGRQEYEDYLAYLEQLEAYALQEEARREQEELSLLSEAREAEARKEQWLADRRLDLESWEEERAYLTAVARGYSGAGMDVSHQQERIRQIDERLREVREALSREGVSTSYQARDRGEIGPNMDIYREEWQRQQEDNMVDHLMRMRAASRNLGLTTEGADLHATLGRHLDNLLNEGTMPSPEDIARARNYMLGRISGQYLAPGELPKEQAHWMLDGESWADGIGEMGRNITTAKSNDGSMSWSGLAGRMAIGALTGGASEWVFTPVGSLYTMKDAVDRGASGLGAFSSAVGQLALQQGLSKAAGSLLKAGGSAVAEGYRSGFSTADALKGMGRGGWNSLRASAAKQGGELVDLFSREAWAETTSRLGDSLMQGGKRAFNIVSGQEGYTGPSVSSALSYVKEQFFDNASMPPLSKLEQLKLDQFNRAVASGDPNQVMALYKNGGMRALADLQKKGAISGAAAQKCNAIVKGQVDGAIQGGTRQAIEDIQRENGVRIKRVLVGDSGSSARSTPVRLKTDYDRTNLIEFNDTDLRKFAWKNGLELDEAYDLLCKKFQQTQTANVNASLAKRGLTTSDVDFASYDRMGAASGHGDSYPASTTRNRQAVMGTAEAYNVSADGNTIGRPIKVSGQGMVDENLQLANKYASAKRAATGGPGKPGTPGGGDEGLFNRLRPAKEEAVGAGTPGSPAGPGGGSVFDPTKISPADTKPVLEQQLKSVFKGGQTTKDAQTMAKSLQRFHKQARVGQYSVDGSGIADEVSRASRESLNQISDDLLGASQEMFADPGKMGEVLKKYGFVDATGNADINQYMQAGEQLFRQSAGSFGLQIPG